MRYLTVLRCLYDEYVCALAMRHEVSWPVNEQSIITTHFGQCFRKSMGRVFLNTSHDGQMIRYFILFGRNTKENKRGFSC